MCLEPISGGQRFSKKLKSAKLVLQKAYQPNNSISPHSSPLEICCQMCERQQKKLQKEIMAKATKETGYSSQV